MVEQSHQLVQKLWNYCNILRDDGLVLGPLVLGPGITILSILTEWVDDGLLYFDYPSTESLLSAGGQLGKRSGREQNTPTH